MTRASPAEVGHVGRWAVWRRRLRRGAIVFVMLIVALEVGARICFENPLRSQKELAAMYATADNGGIRSVPGFRGEATLDGRTVPIALNRLGLRSPELGERSGDEVRVLFLGDSWVFGLGVLAEETFASATGELLSKQLGRPVVVGNAGVPGYGSISQVRCLERVLVEFDPDLVVSSIYLGNDFLDDRAPAQYIYDGAVYSGPWARLFRRSIRARWMLRSRFLLQAELALMQFGSCHALRAEEPEDVFAGFPPKEPRNQRHACLFMEAIDQDLHYDEIEGTSVIRRGLDQIRVSLEAMQRTAGDVPVVALVSPSRWHVDLVERQDIMRRVLLDGTLYRPGIVQERLRVRLEHLKMPFVDVTRDLRWHNDRGEIFLSDGHLNPAGHQVIARRLVEKVVEELASRGR